VEELAAVDIGEGEVSQVDLIGTPSGIGGFEGGFRELDSLAKEGEFKAVAVTGWVVKVAGVIPPFGLIIGVVKMIGGEMVAVAGKG
jgi:hypothetical protein